MAASGYTPISLYYSTTASAVPTAGNLANGELALNIADMKLYAKNSAGTVTLLASNASTTGVDSLSFGSTGLTPSTATTGAITVAGTLNVANGGTGKTSYTANGILYASGTGTLANGSALTFDGTSNVVIGNSNASYGSTGNVYIDATGGGSVYLRVAGYGPSIQVTSTSIPVFSVNGSEGMRLTSTGLGIGTSSPSAKLHVFTSASTADQILEGNGSNNGANLYFYADISSSGNKYRSAISGINASGSALTFSTTTNGNTAPTERVRVDASGNVGIGTSSPAYKLHVSGSAYVTSKLLLDTGTAAAPPLTFYGWTNSGIYNPEGNSVAFTVNSTERFRISSSGQFGIGGANYGTAGQVLTSQGSGAAPTWATASSGAQAFVAFGSTGGY